MTRRLFIFIGALLISGTTMSYAQNITICRGGYDCDMSVDCGDVFPKAKQYCRDVDAQCYNVITLSSYAGGECGHSRYQVICGDKRVPGVPGGVNVARAVPVCPPPSQSTD